MRKLIATMIVFAACATVMPHSVTAGKVVKQTDVCPMSSSAASPAPDLFKESAVVSSWIEPTCAEGNVGCVEYCHDLGAGCAPSLDLCPC